MYLHKSPSPRNKINELQVFEGTFKKKFALDKIFVS